jgi:hypothetical protein
MGFAEWCLVAMGSVATDSVEQRLVVKGLVAMESAEECLAATDSAQ